MATHFWRPFHLVVVCMVALSLLTAPASQAAEAPERAVNSPHALPDDLLQYAAQKIVISGEAGD